MTLLRLLGTYRGGFALGAFYGFMFALAIFGLATSPRKGRKS